MEQFVYNLTLQSCHIRDRHLYNTIMASSLIFSRDLIFDDIIMLDVQEEAKVSALHNQGYYCIIPVHHIKAPVPGKYAIIFFFLGHIDF